METEIQFSELLKKYRRAHGVTQKQLADLTNIPLTTIQKYERGVFNPKLRNLAILAEVLQIPEAQLNQLDVFKYIDPRFSNSKSISPEISNKINELNSLVKKLVFEKEPEIESTGEQIHSKVSELVNLTKQKVK